MSELDAIVVGSGPNGLAAAVTLARAGLTVRVYERAEQIGGGTRTLPLTLPGYLHDHCSAVHPMAVAGDFFRRFGLTERTGFVTPEVSYAHPLDGGRAALAWRDLDRTAEGLGRDGPAWLRFFGPLVRHVDEVAGFSGDTLMRIPEYPATLVRFGLRALELGLPTWNLRFAEDAANALVTGVMAHTIQKMPGVGPAAAGLALGAYAHAGGWPVPIGGSVRIAEVLADDLIAHGGRIETGVDVRDLRDLPRARIVLFDTSPRAVVRIAGGKLPERAARQLLRFPMGNAAAKVDFALSGPVPWADPEVALAGTVHIGGTRAELAAAEADVAAGRHPERPYVLAAQPSSFDDSRAPAGRHTLWTYTHVPKGSDVDVTESIVRQVERFAPGFRDLILASTATSAVQLEADNPNYIGGDIAIGRSDAFHLIARPRLSPKPWRLAARGLYLCSSATPPGPGVHGQAGFHAAMTALGDEFGIREAPDLAPGTRIPADQ